MEDIQTQLIAILEQLNTIRTDPRVNNYGPLPDYLDEAIGGVDAASDFILYCKEHKEKKL